MHDKSIQTDEETMTHEPGPEPVKFPSAQTLNCPGKLVGPEAIPDPIKELKKDIQQKEKTIIGLNNSYERLEAQKTKQITELQEKIKTITHQLSELKTHQNQDQKD
jgi:septal ring factor EnvC (AmiA/AmiB activator)